MKKLFFILVSLFVICRVPAQQIEPARYEVGRWSKDQGCHFESFGAKGGILVSQTDRTDEHKSQLWNFALLDSSLYEMRTDLIPLSSRMSFAGSASDDDFAVFLFTNDKLKKTDTISFCAICFNRKDLTYKSFGEMLPEKTVIHSLEVVDGNMMMAVNDKTGNGTLLFFDLNSNSYRSVNPSLANSFILFQTASFQKQHCFVVAAREYENKRYVATSFLVYSPSGALLQKHRYENGENAGLGRMCFDFDENQRLVVMGTLEQESNKKVDLEGVTENFDKISVGVVWIRFDGMAQTKAYLFKNMPEIELALTASDRVRVREERLKSGKNKEKEKKEIAFQFLTPRLTHYGDLSVFAAEAFVPEYHTETRMNYGYGFGFYGAHPYTYTIFDGYDFISEILLAFDKDGDLKWQTSVKFDNYLTYDLTRHCGEAVCHDELVVTSSCENALRYVVFDADGQPLLNQQSADIEPMHGADYVEDEYFAQIEPWFGSRFLIFGCQAIQNGVLPTPHRTVFFLQKVQYE